MKRFVIAVALACALSGPVLAGDIHSVDSQAPGPGPITVLPGQIPSTDVPVPEAESTVLTIILMIVSVVS